MRMMNNTSNLLINTEKSNLLPFLVNKLARDVWQRREQVPTELRNATTKCHQELSYSVSPACGEFINNGESRKPYRRKRHNIVFDRFRAGKWDISMKKAAFFVSSCAWFFSRLLLDSQNLWPISILCRDSVTLMTLHCYSQAIPKKSKITRLGCFL